MWVGPIHPAGGLERALQRGCSSSDRPRMQYGEHWEGTGLEQAEPTDKLAYGRVCTQGVSQGSKLGWWPWARRELKEGNLKLQIHPRLV